MVDWCRGLFRFDLWGWSLGSELPITPWTLERELFRLSYVRGLVAP